MASQEFSLRPAVEADERDRSACPDLGALEQYLGACVEDCPSNLLPLASHLQTCGQCRDLLEQVRANLRMATDVRRLRPVVADSSDPASLLMPLPRPSIAGFDLVREIGRGGMGVVYEARQHQPPRIVALKVAHADINSSRGLRLLDREVAALARLQHGNIAALFDAGRAIDQRPWFAMEFVDGVRLKIDPQFASQSVAMRVQRFLPVVDAIAYAHQRGVIHRDLKPSNIMIRADGVPKVLDFGLAKFFSSIDGTFEETVTEIGNLQGTIPYMSPEQTRGNSANVDVRSDIYSLGVVLYELLCGRLPYEVNPADLLESARSICEKEPVAPYLLNPAISRDLSAVLQKALAKSPDGRYKAATLFADDLRNCLAGRPVSAKPLTTRYQLLVLIRRHRLATALIAALATVTVAYSIAATLLLKSSRASALQAEQARDVAILESDRAAEETRRAERVTGLLADVFRAADPKYGGEHSLSARALLERGTAATLRNADDPVTRAALLQVLGDSFRHLGDWDHAREMLAESLALWREHKPDNTYRIAGVLVSLAELEDLAGNRNTAENYFHDAYDVLQNRLGDADLHVLTTLRGALRSAEDWTAVEAICRAALDSTEQHPIPPTARIGWQNQLAEALDQQGRFVEAVPVMRAALATVSELPGFYRENVKLTLQGNLAWLLVQVDELQEAESLATSVLQARRKILPPKHLELSTTLLTLGIAKQRLGFVQEARALLEECLTIRAATLPEDDDRVVEAQRFLSECPSVSP